MARFIWPLKLGDLVLRGRAIGTDRLEFFPGAGEMLTRMRGGRHDGDEAVCDRIARRRDGDRAKRRREQANY